MSQVSATQQLTAIKEQLLTSLCKKADAEAEVAKHQETINALRNVLAGVPVGEALATEAFSAKAAAEQAAQVPQLTP